jgi:secreted trypsin-like serine protease
MGLAEALFLSAVSIASSGTRRVVGGSSADAGELPWIAAVLRNGIQVAPLRACWARSERPWRRVQECGATLIADGVLLSAAHCFTLDETHGWKNYTVVLGHTEYGLGSQVRARPE